MPSSPALTSRSHATAVPTTTVLSTAPVRLQVAWTPAHVDDVGHRLTFRNGSSSIRWSVLSSIDAGGGSGGGTLHRWSMPNLQSLPGWRAEWEIPFEALGIAPKAGGKIAFNLGVYRAEDRIWRSLEGALGENWRLDQAAVLLLK